VSSIPPPFEVREGRGEGTGSVGEKRLRGDRHGSRGAERSFALSVSSRVMLAALTPARDHGVKVTRHHQRSRSPTGKWTELKTRCAACRFGFLPEGSRECTAEHRAVAVILIESPSRPGANTVGATDRGSARPDRLLSRSPPRDRESDVVLPLRNVAFRDGGVRGAGVRSLPGATIPPGDAPARERAARHSGSAPVVLRSFRSTAPRPSAPAIAVGTLVKRCVSAKKG